MRPQTFLLTMTIWSPGIDGGEEQDTYNRDLEHFSVSDNSSQAYSEFSENFTQLETNVHSSIFGIIQQTQEEEGAVFSVINEVHTRNETNILSKNVPEVISTGPRVTQVNPQDYGLKLNWWQVLLVFCATLLFSFNCLYFTKCCYLTVDCCADPYWCCCPSCKALLKLVKPLPKKDKSKKKITLADISTPVSVNKSPDPLESTVSNADAGKGNGKPPPHTRVKESPVELRRNRNPSRGTSPIQILRRPNSTSQDIRESSLSLRSSSTLLINRSISCESQQKKQVENEKVEDIVESSEVQAASEPPKASPTEEKKTLQFNTLPQSSQTKEESFNTIPIKIIKEDDDKKERAPQSNFGRPSNFTWMRSLSLNRSKKCKISSRNLSRARSSSYSRSSEYHYIADFQSSLVVATKLTKKTSTLSSYQAKPTVFKRSMSSESIASIESDSASEVSPGPQMTQSEKILPRSGKSSLRMEGRNSGMSFSRRSTPVTCPTTPLMMEYNFKAFERSLSLSKETCI